MERKNKQIRYRKIGGGSLKFKGRFIKPNQIFLAYPREIPKAFEDCIIPIDPQEIKDEEESTEIQNEDVVNATYSIKKKGGGYYDIVNKEGKIISEKSLRREEAEQMCKELNI